jgi:hypothetical protein
MGQSLDPQLASIGCGALGDSNFWERHTVTVLPDARKKEPSHQGIENVLRTVREDTTPLR